MRELLEDSQRQLFQRAHTFVGTYHSALHFLREGNFHAKVQVSHAERWFHRCLWDMSYAYWGFQGAIEGGHRGFRFGGQKFCGTFPRWGDRNIDHQML